MIRLIIPEIGDEEVQAVSAVLRSGYLVMLDENLDRAAVMTHMQAIE